MGIVKNFYIDKAIYENNKSKSDIKAADKVGKVKPDIETDGKSRKPKTPKGE